MAGNSGSGKWAYYNAFVRSTASSGRRAQADKIERRERLRAESPF